MVHVLGGAALFDRGAAGADRSSVAEHVALVGLGLVSALLGVAAMRARRRWSSAPSAPARLPIWGRPVLGRAIVAVSGDARPGRRPLVSGHGALALDSAREVPCAGADGADRPEADGMPGVAGQRLSRRPVFRLALYRRAARQAVRARRRGGVPGPASSETACLFARHGDARLGHRRRAADDGVAGAGRGSGDVLVAGPVLAGCIASQLLTRAIFGYSFSTWRLHLRGGGHFGRPRRRLGAHDPGRRHDGCENAHHAGRGDARRLPPRPPARRLALCRAGRPPGPLPCGVRCHGRGARQRRRNPRWF